MFFELHREQTVFLNQPFMVNFHACVNLPCRLFDRSNRRSLKRKGSIFLSQKRQQTNNKTK